MNLTVLLKGVVKFNIKSLLLCLILRDNVTITDQLFQRYVSLHGIITESE